MDNAEERISELEDRNFKIIQSEDNKAKRMIRSEERLHDLWDTIKRFPEGRKLIEEMMVENFPNLGEI